MRHVKSAAVLVFVTVACSGSDEGVVAVTPGQVAYVSDVDATTNEVMWGAAAADPFDFAAVIQSGDATATSTTADPVATAAAAAVNTYYLPAGCATATASGSETTYTLNKCTDPLGTTNVSGTINVFFTAQPATNGAQASLLLEAKTTGLVVGPVTVNFDRKAVLSGSGANRTLQMISDASSASGPNGNLVSSNNGQGTLTWTVGSKCTTSNRTNALSFKNGSRFTATYMNVVRCLGECPQSGSITLTNGSGGAAAITYNGTSTATVTRTNAPTTSVSLVCGG